MVGCTLVLSNLRHREFSEKSVLDDCRTLIINLGFLKTIVHRLSKDKYFNYAAYSLSALIQYGKRRDSLRWYCRSIRSYSRWHPAGPHGFALHRGSRERCQQGRCHVEQPRRCYGPVLQARFADLFSMAEEDFVKIYTRWNSSSHLDFTIRPHPFRKCSKWNRLGSRSYVDHFAIRFPNNGYVTT